MLVLCFIRQLFSAKILGYIQLKSFKSKKSSPIDELRKGANKRKWKCTLLNSWKVKRVSPVRVPAEHARPERPPTSIGSSQTLPSLHLATFWQQNYFKSLGKLSPTTRLETSFDASGPTKCDDRHVIPEGQAVSVLPTTTHDKVKLTVVQFERENPGLKWFLRIMSIMLLVCLLFLWIYYR